jgi:DNA-binding transcriptional regulator YiaG
MGMQRYELEAWIGDDHGLSDDQLDDLLAEAQEIEERYPDADDQAERDAALSAAYRLKVEPLEDVLADFSKQRADARAAESAASAALQQAAQSVIPGDQLSEAAFARTVGVDRMTVRKWTQDRKDRALFDQAIFTLVRADMPEVDQQQLSAALGIRDTSAQAGVLLTALEVGSTEEFTAEKRALIARAEKRARQIV